MRYSNRKGGIAVLHRVRRIRKKPFISSLTKKSSGCSLVFVNFLEDVVALVKECVLSPVKRGSFIVDLKLE